MLKNAYFGEKQNLSLQVRAVSRRRAISMFQVGPGFKNMSASNGRNTLFFFNSGKIKDNLA